jgi:hypothetical protein
MVIICVLDIVKFIRILWNYILVVFAWQKMKNNQSHNNQIPLLKTIVKLVVINIMEKMKKDHVVFVATEEFFNFTGSHKMNNKPTEAPLLDRENIGLVECPQCGHHVQYEPGEGKTTCSECCHRFNPFYWEDEV